MAAQCTGAALQNPVHAASADGVQHLLIHLKWEVVLQTETKATAKKEAFLRVVRQPSAAFLIPRQSAQGRYVSMVTGFELVQGAASLWTASYMSGRGHTCKRGMHLWAILFL